MAITLSKPPRSSWSNFFHDLVTVDFHQIDINTGVRIANIGNHNSSRVDHRLCC